jgi:hypothetical protein
MASSLVLLNRRSMMRALLCKIVILLVQEVSVSKLGLQLEGSVKRRLNSFPTSLTRTEILDAALMPRL